MSGVRTQTQNERVLGLLREAPGFVSGQEICRRLGITRSAVWKHVGALRRQGFSIRGVASRGYRLDPESEGLGVLALDGVPPGRRIGKRIVFRNETGSTNEDARLLAREGAEEGTVVVAESQTEGRGRMGRSWVSPPHTNLYLSVILRPDLPPANAAWCTLLASVELCRTVRDLYGLDPGLKWPNDLLLEGRKAAGILAEMEAEIDRVRFVVLGVGVNLNMPADLLPERALYPATSLSLVLGRKVNRVAFARRFLEHLDRGYGRLLREGPEAVRDAWMGFSVHGAGTVRVTVPGGTLQGRFLGIDETGAMILENAQGKKRTVHVGDVVAFR